MILNQKQEWERVSKLQVWEAFKKVKENGGSAGVDGVTIKNIESNLRKYLYPVWNRMVSGSYFPQAVREVLIPKSDGGNRPLGIPTVCDRVAQMVIKEELELIADKHFSDNSFGYRPNKDAHQAVEQCRLNCLSNNWVIEIDIKGFFDNIDHDLMMRAVRRFTEKKHILLYVERWLKASVRRKDGEIEKRDKGTPQGGVISPLLANIFLHFAFDTWIEEEFTGVVYERYADDIVIHAKHFKQALTVLDAVKKRFKRCKLELKSGKSNIVYCKRNQKKQPPFKPKYVSFDFLGFTFKPRLIKTKQNKLYRGFTPGMSQKRQVLINQILIKMKIHRMVHLQLSDLAKMLNSKVRGWINYYGKVRLSEMRKLFKQLNFRLAKWVRNKYRRFRNRARSVPYNWLKDVSVKYPKLFVHWQFGFVP